MKKSPKITIASFTSKDVKQAHTLLHHVIRHHPNYGKEARNHWESFYTPAKLRTYLKNKEWIMLVAKHGPKVIGFTNVWQMWGGVARSDWSVVHPAYQHLGIGAALLTAKLKACKKKGCHKMITDSIPSNKAGERLLKST